MGKRPTLETQLGDLTTLTHRMADRVLAGLNVLLQHFEVEDSEELIKLAVSDTEVDELEVAIDGIILQILATQKPLGFELRYAYASAKIANHLERMGDAIQSLARQLSVRSFSSQRDLVQQMLFATREIFVSTYAAMFEEDYTQIRDIDVRDDKVDALQRELYLQAKDILLEAATKERGDVEAALELINIGNRIEKVADLCGDWAFQINFARNNETAKIRKPTRYKVVFLDASRGFSASVAASLLFEMVGDLIDISVVTASDEAPISLLDFSDALASESVKAQAFPVAKIGTARWQKVLLYVEVGTLEIPDEELDLIPHKAVRLSWKNLNVKWEELMTELSNTDLQRNANSKVSQLVKQTRVHVERIAQLIARSQGS